MIDFGIVSKELKKQVAPLNAEMATYLEDSAKVNSAQVVSFLMDYIKNVIHKEMKKEQSPHAYIPWESFRKALQTFKNDKLPWEDRSQLTEEKALEIMAAMGYPNKVNEEAIIFTFNPEVTQVGGTSAEAEAE